MDMEYRDGFAARWREYFGAAELPICFYYSDERPPGGAGADPAKGRCLIENISRVRDGHSYVYDASAAGCPGGKRYAGFRNSLRPGFEYFLSYGVPGEMEGERYKKSPELVREFLARHPATVAPGRFLVFKRWDCLEESDQPLVVVFFARPDVLSGLYTLANFDRAATAGVIAPMGAGCASIISYPLLEAESEQPRAVLGMFDVSARPHVPADMLTLAVPMKRLAEMIANMDESFLITSSWRQVRERI